MESLALDLIEYIKNDADQTQNVKELYKSLMDALSDMEYLATIPEHLNNQKVVEDAWSICETRWKLLDPGCHYYDDTIPKYLLDVTGIKGYFTDYVLYEIEEKIDNVFPDNYEYIESEAIENVIKAETLNNCEELLNDYVDYMREEYDQDLEVYNDYGTPYIVKYGKITERAVLDYEKIVEIADTSDYFNIEFDWSVMSNIMLSDSEFLRIFKNKISKLISDKNVLELYQELAEKLRNNGYLDNYDPEDVVNRMLKRTKFFQMEDVCKLDAFDFYTRILVENESGFIAYIGE